MKHKKSTNMEKAENADIQKVRSMKAGEKVPSPNTKRRLRIHPTLSIKIPFLNKGHKTASPPVIQDEKRLRPAFLSSQSLPSESHMPSNIHDVLLCDTSECDMSFDQTDDKCNVEDLKDEGSTQEKDAEDEVESEKHQSDLEENEKDNEKENSTKGSETSETVKRPATPDVKGICLKSCLKVGRRRASTYPGPVDCLEATFKRCVRFSPDTVEPTPRNCKYREWIERRCHGAKCPPINIKHEKRKCQLNQMRKVNISDYMSKNYSSSFFSPVGSFGGDMLL